MRSYGRLCRKVTASGLVFLLLLAGLPSCALQPRIDWSRVQAVPPSKKTEVRLYQDAPPGESRRIKGRFESATADSITLVLKDGQTRTVKKQAVRKILTHRPFVERWPGWVALGCTALFASAPENGGIFYLYLTLPVTAAFFYGSQMGPIYNVPPKHRMLPQGDKQPGAQDKASGKQEDPRD